MNRHPIYFHIYPRYAAGSPAMVPEKTATRVAAQEVEAAREAMRGQFGGAAQARAERLGLRGIAESTQECPRRRGWMVHDLITDERYLRPYDEVLRKAGYVFWCELPGHIRKEYPDDAPPEVNRRWWFTVSELGEPIPWLPQLESAAGAAPR